MHLQFWKTAKLCSQKAVPVFTPTGSVCITQLCFTEGSAQTQPHGPCSWTYYGIYAQHSVGDITQPLPESPTWDCTWVMRRSKETLRETQAGWRWTSGDSWGDPCILSFIQGAYHFFLLEVLHSLCRKHAHTHFPISCVLDSICFLDKQSKAHWRCCYIPAWPCRWTSVYWVSSAVWLPGSGKKWHLDWLDLSCIVNYCVFRILHCFVYSAYHPSLFDAGLLWEEWAFEPHDQKWLEKEAKYKPKLDLWPWAQISHYKTEYPWKQ